VSLSAAERALVAACRKEEARVYLSCPLALARASPRALEAVSVYVRRLVGRPDLRLRTPPRDGRGWNLRRRARKEPGPRVLVMLAEAGGYLGLRTAAEWRAFAACGQPLFAVLPGRGLVSGEELALVDVAPGERTAQRFARLVEREGRP